jgi:secreted trypsin-like serine protease
MISKFSVFSKVALTSLLVTGLVACSSGKQNNDSGIVLKSKSSSIIGGDPVLTSDVISKTTVAIVLDITDKDGKEAQALCTGTLIAKNIVLTAGHCAQGQAPTDKVRILLAFNSDLNKIQKTDVRIVTQVVIHPNYGKTGSDGEDMNDLSLMKFTGDLPAGYQVAQFLADESVLVPDAVVTLAGYGLTDGTNQTSDNLLRKVDVKIAEAFGKTEIVLDQTEGKGACHGDSGGPALINVNGTEYVWGVTSRGVGKDGKDDCSLASVYTKIKSQSDFVQSAIAQLSK